MEEPSTSSASSSTSSLGNQSESAAAGDGTDGQSVCGSNEFLSTGRTGRRNALPDILEERSTHLNTADLPLQMEKLSCTDSSVSPQHPNGNGSGDASGNENK